VKLSWRIEFLPSSMPSTINLSGVSMVYSREDGPSTAALEEVTLEVPARQIMCIVGPSGCGKTTLLNIAAGFIAPTAGRVLIDGVPVAESRARCGFTFQTEAVFPWMTVAENVGYGLRWSGRSPEQRSAVVHHYLQRVGLTGFAGHWPRELSGGMRKRVDLARAFAVDPPVLLLDEPFGSLDSLTRVQMQQLLLEVWRADRKTLMAVTHDVEEALFLGDKVAVMSSRPARVTRVISVPFSPEDRVADLKLSPEFIALRREVLATLGAPD